MNQTLACSGMESTDNSSDSFTVTTKTYPDTSWWRHPKIRENWKVVLASSILFFVGTILLVSGVAIEIARTPGQSTQAKTMSSHLALLAFASKLCFVVEFCHQLSEKSPCQVIGAKQWYSSFVQSFVFFIAGAICFIPGAYHVVYIYCAVRGRKGFSFYNLPVFR